MMQRSETEFLSGGLRCRAWHYVPENANGAAIVMAHGLGGTRHCSLDKYARLFAQDGFNVLLFDYRYLGDSDGEPRQLILPERQVEDWLAAIAYARKLPGVDGARIGLWGSSYSGGHVMVAAARDGRVKAVTAQCPMLDGMAATKQLIRYAGLGYALKLVGAGLRDAINDKLGRAPVRIPLIAQPGEVAFMSSADALPGYSALTPDDWRNEACARLALVGGNYQPVKFASKLPCKALIISCEQDSVAPAEVCHEFARRAGSKVRLESWDIGHFDVYQAEYFERASQIQLEHFREELVTA